MKEILIESLKVAIPIAAAALLYGVAALVQRRRKKSGASVAQQAAIDAACQAAKQLLDQMLFGAVTEAERAWGDGTGAAKLDFVRERVLALLP